MNQRSKKARVTLKIRKGPKMMSVFKHIEEMNVLHNEIHNLRISNVAHEALTREADDNIGKLHVANLTLEVQASDARAKLHRAEVEVTALRELLLRCASHMSAEDVMGLFINSDGMSFVASSQGRDADVHAPNCAQRFNGASECTCHVAKG